MEETLIQVMIEQMGMSESAVQEYVVSMDDGKLEEFIGQMIAEQVKSQFAVGVQQQLGEMSTAQLAAALEPVSYTHLGNVRIS